MEYVLLLVVAVAIAASLTRLLIGRDEGSPGFVIEAWNAILIEIGKDYPDDIRRETDPE